MVKLRSSQHSVRKQQHTHDKPVHFRNEGQNNVRIDEDDIDESDFQPPPPDDYDD